MALKRPEKTCQECQSASRTGSSQERSLEQNRHPDHRPGRTDALQNFKFFPAPNDGLLNTRADNKNDRNTEQRSDDNSGNPDNGDNGLKRSRPFLPIFQVFNARQRGEIPGQALQIRTMAEGFFQRQQVRSRKWVSFNPRQQLPVSGKASCELGIGLLFGDEANLLYLWLVEENLLQTGTLRRGQIIP